MPIILCQTRLEVQSVMHGSREIAWIFVLDLAEGLSIFPRVTTQVENSPYCGN